MCLLFNAAGHSASQVYSMCVERARAVADKDGSPPQSVLLDTSIVPAMRTLRRIVQEHERDTYGGVDHNASKVRFQTTSVTAP